MKTLYAFQSRTILDNLNAAIEQLAILTATLAPQTPEGAAAIRADVRARYARDALMHALTIDAQAEPINEVQS